MGAKKKIEIDDPLLTFFISGVALTLAGLSNSAYFSCIGYIFGGLFCLTEYYK